MAPEIHDPDPQETHDWLESLRAVVEGPGRGRAAYLLDRLIEEGQKVGVRPTYAANTPYINTIPPDQQPEYPGDLDLERRIRSIIRWNAMAMVVRANKESPGIGGHISTYASAATLFEVGFNHFFRGDVGGPEGPPGPLGKPARRPRDQVYFQGHASPGIYARAFLEGRLEARHLINFRRELQPGGGLASYPHPWLMPDFWGFPTVSMGLSPIMSIYQARFNRYLRDRGIADTSDCRVWAFLGDGEMDEPESLGAITLASREKLNNLIWVVNCNLQRLDGPVRGNGKIIQELEAAFSGAGWNVIKVIWGSNWDPLLAADHDGILVRRMTETCDGQYQKYVVESGDYLRQHFFGAHEKLLQMVEHLSDAELKKLQRGGHDPVKVYAAYKAACESTDRPTVILAKTIKGYGLGEAGEGKNVTHQQKKLNEDELREFRDRFNIPITDEQLEKLPFYHPGPNSPEVRYLRERREKLGGFVPYRLVDAPPIDAPPLENFVELTQGSGKERELATTMVFVRMLALLMKDPRIGKYIVPIVPDEARTFGMEALFPQYKIYSSVGQLYEPVDSKMLLAYRESEKGQLLEEGITEAGAMSSFIAAGSAYSTHGINTIPFFIFYSMFGFQRVGDLIWAAADQRVRGFLLGATAGRTTLAGEGLQHQDGHSHVIAGCVPTCQPYDCAFGYELPVIILDGIRRMYHEGQSIFYYLTLYNEKYEMPAMPSDAAEGILRGIYKLLPAGPQGGKGKNRPPRVHLFGSGTILREAIRAREMLAKDFGVEAAVWSVTSYPLLCRDALACERWNMLHPDEKPRVPHLTRVLQEEPYPVVAATDYVKELSGQAARWTPAGLTALGTDGFGRSDDRASLRRHFEVDAEFIALAALHRLAERGEIPKGRVKEALRRLEIDPAKLDPARA